MYSYCYCCYYYNLVSLSVAMFLLLFVKPTVISHIIMKFLFFILFFKTLFLFFLSTILMIGCNKGWIDLTSAGRKMGDMD